MKLENDFLYETDDVYIFPSRESGKRFSVIHMRLWASLYFEPVDQQALAQALQPLKENCCKMPYSMTICLDPNVSMM